MSRRASPLGCRPLSTVAPTPCRMLDSRSFAGEVSETACEGDIKSVGRSTHLEVGVHATRQTCFICSASQSSVDAIAAVESALEPIAGARDDPADECGCRHGAWT